ncbi:MAG TPA: substrate-binding domain-containing protein [Acidimicrobiales bacterium]|nr:substrate-binding domain-containing protein [Acidimicrobiales bacterium]
MNAGGPRVDDRLRLARLARGLSQGALADMAGVTRQSISGIESGRWSPSLDVALALAAALGASIEDLFGAAPELPAIETRLAARLVGPTRVLVSEIDGDPVAFPLVGDQGFAAGFRPAFGQATSTSPAPAGSLVVTEPIAALGPTLAIAGCDPALALLAGPLERHRPPNGLVWWACSNAAALRLLKAGTVHAAAVHRNAHDRPRRQAGHEIVGFASWREGLVVAARYAKTVHGLAEALELGLRLVNREPGSEARRLLDDALGDLGAEPTALSGYDTACSAHLLVASSIAAGLADVGVASEPAALAYGLGFVAWQEEICELHIPRSLLGTAEIRALLDVLAGSELPAQLAAIAAYDAGPCGKLSEA